MEKKFAERNGTIRVVICDDHPQMRVGIREALEQAKDLEVVGEAGDGVEALSLIGELRPHVAVMDLKMPRMEGPDAIARMHEAGYRETKILVFTTYEDDPLLARALRAGARTVLYKGASALEIRETVREVARGGFHLHTEAQQELLKMVQTPVQGELTVREIDILRMISEGRGNTEMAAELWISANTIKDHVSSLYAKLGVKKREQAVSEGYRRGYLRVR